MPFRVNTESRLRRLLSVVLTVGVLASVAGCRTLSEAYKQAAHVGKINGRDTYAFEFVYNRFLVGSMQERQINANSKLYCTSGSSIIKRERVRETESQYYISGVLGSVDIYLKAMIVAARFQEA